MHNIYQEGNNDTKKKKKITTGTLKTGRPWT